MPKDSERREDPEENAYINHMIWPIKFQSWSTRLRIQSSLMQISNFLIMPFKVKGSGFSIAAPTGATA
jgi:hypothetical protein